VGVDRRHADRRHLLALVREALRVDDEPRHPVDQHVGPDGGDVGRGLRDHVGAVVGERRDLGGQFGVGK